MAALIDPRLGVVQLGAVAYAGFPVRRITQKINESSGEWVIAYQADQRRHLEAVIVPLVTERVTRHGSKLLRPPTNTREASGVPGRKVLDRSFLLNHCYGREPSDLCVCNISGVELQDYKCEDFADFDNVVSINAADNHLPLEAFRTFPCLEELELSLNGIVDVAIEPGHLTDLHTLNLSYNSLSEGALLALGTLPQLKVLHLTGNNIVALPVEMSRPYPSPNQTNVMEIRYPALEQLWLDDNKLTDQATFATLAGMRKLKYLNLDNNEIYMIPHLKLLGTSPLKPAKLSTELSTSIATSSPFLTATPDLIHSRSTLPVSQDGDRETVDEDGRECHNAGARNSGENDGVVGGQNSDQNDAINTSADGQNGGQNDAVASRQNSSQNDAINAVASGQDNGHNDAINTVVNGQNGDQNATTDQSVGGENGEGAEKESDSQITSGVDGNVTNEASRVGDEVERVKETEVDPQKREEEEKARADGEEPMDGDKTLPKQSGESKIENERDVERAEKEEGTTGESEQQLNKSLHSKASLGECTTPLPPNQTAVNHPNSTQTDQSAPSSPTSTSNVTGTVDDLQPVSGEDEISKELAPFPQLETLSLVNNMILREEGVVACSTWPALKQLIIYDNPLTRTLKGMPPLLQSHLVDQCGVTVIRKKPGMERKCHIGKAAKDFKKVSSAPPPTIPKYALPALEAPPISSTGLLMLEAGSPFSHSQSPSSHLSFDGSRPQSTTPTSPSGSGDADVSSSDASVAGKGREISDERTRGDEEDRRDTDLQGVFLTQVDGEEPTEMSNRHCQAGGMATSPSAWDHRSTIGEEFRAKKRELRQRYKRLPSRYRGYEALMDTFDDPSLGVPKDLGGCTRALQHVLKHPLVLSDSNSKSPSVSSHSGSTQAQPTGQYLKRKPAVMSVVPKPTHAGSHKVRQLQEVLDEVRTQCNTLETNLASVLAPGPDDSLQGQGTGAMAEGRRSISDLQRESRKLLAEMQARYDQVRAQSLSSVQALSAELQRQSGALSGRKRTPKSMARVTFSSDGTK